MEKLWLGDLELKGFIEEKGQFFFQWGPQGHVGGPGEVFRGQRGAVCQFFEQGGAAKTEGGQITRGFCNFYSQAGPKLASRLGKERSFL